MEHLIPQRSVSVELIAYDRLRRELFVTYAGGRRYVYRQVPPFVFRQLKAVEARGDSVGQYVNWRVKPVYFDYAEVGRDPAGARPSRDADRAARGQGPAHR